MSELYKRTMDAFEEIARIENNSELLSFVKEERNRVISESLNEDKPELSMREALFDLNNKELDEKIQYPMNQNTWVFKGQTYLDGRPYVYERQGIYTTASSQRQAVNNIIYKLCDGDKQKIYRMDIDETGLELIGDMSKGIKKEKEEDDFSGRQLSMFDMMDEEFNQKEYLSDFITDDIIVLLVDDIDKYDGKWVDKEFEKDFDDEDELEEDVNDTASNEKFIVSKEDLQKVLKNISSSNDINILPSKKNNEFQKDRNLSKEDQIKIIKALSIEDYAYSTLSRNELHKGSVLTIFFPKLELTINGQSIKGLTMYIKIDDSVAGKIVVVSLHSGSDVKEHPYKDENNEKQEKKEMIDVIKEGWHDELDVYSRTDWKYIFVVVDLERLALEAAFFNQSDADDLAIRLEEETGRRYETIRTKLYK